ncbi:MAG: YqaJ viral recombinase family protein [Chromatiaceae bacterium]|nr:YqaJ viral recombinase family protein [Chromatiaceae bacterium]
MNDLTRFHQDRLSGLGGSDIGAILGLNPWRTPYQVFLEKIGEAPPFEGNLQTRFGQHAEEFVAWEYCHQTGRQVQRFTAMLRHPEVPLIGHVDRLVVPEGAKKASHLGQIRTDLGLEAKTASAFATGRASEWGESGSDQVPEAYLVQCATYMALTECPRWDLAVLFGNTEFRIYHLTRDLELEAMILDEAARFWTDHVLARNPPTPSSEAEARQRWPRHSEGKVLEADLEIRALLSQLAEYKRQGQKVAAQEQITKDRLLPLLADADSVRHGSLILATYRANKDSQRTDWQRVAGALMQDQPGERIDALMAEYTHTQPGSRVLRLAKPTRD